MSPVTNKKRLNAILSASARHGSLGVSTLGSVLLRVWAIFSLVIPAA
jgi:hypothetical protein